ncbi:FIST N-terminal domain-containing protein [Amaricoccus sp.]|uniref:FIST N-terminal domain-containing protein n=1 Tax=Amaricoccus sp. TaxID=1872485 RepID=UPI001B4E979C|nr:FIST N-terminal domain-containing protein [Amaricoccus sp.]MBP7243092.1 FIST C-terminal domain-containing protein [Amaricoccus sp.]
MAANPQELSGPRQRPQVVSVSGDVRRTAAEIRVAVGGVAPALVLVFAPEGAALPRITGELREALGPGARVLGCSSAGGFAFGGYRDDRVVAVAFPAAGFRAEAIWLRDLRQHMALDWIRALRRLAEGFGAAAPGWSRFGLLMIDGLSRREEVVAATVDAALGDLPVLGGSAGDGLRFDRTVLALDGESHGESAIFCLVASAFPVEEVIFDHFTPESGRMVVTEALPEERVILTINAEPAAEEYARLIGVAEAALGPRAFAAHPLLTRQGGRHVVRAIQSVTPERGLSLMSSVETGTTMTLGRAESMTERLEARMAELGPAALILGFDCVLRRVALEQAGLGPAVGRIYRQHRVAGFNTYGEQHGGLHVNQTFVGLAFLEPGGTHAATH